MAPVLLEGHKTSGELKASILSGLRPPLAEGLLFSPRRLCLIFFWNGMGDDERGKARQLLILFLQEGESEEMTDFKKQMLALLLALHSRVERTEAVQEQQDQALQVKP